MENFEANLIAAIGNDDGEALSQVLAEAPQAAAARDEMGISAVILALYHGKREMAEEIAATKAELDLFEAAALGRVEEVDALLDAEPDRIDDVSADGFRPLHLGAFLGGFAVVKLLLERGADPVAVADNPMLVQPLHSAVAAGQQAVVEGLLASGADVNARQQRGITPLMGAAAGGHAAMVRVLLEAGADPQLLSEDGQRAADLASERGHEELVDLL